MMARAVLFTAKSCSIRWKGVRDIIEKRLLNKCQESDNFELRFMPIFNAQTLHIDGAECLIRCPALFDIKAGPDEFIPVAEKSNLISKLDMGY